MRKGRSLELYFIDGKPDGMLTAEVFNWTGHVLRTPRTKIAEALKRPEAAYTGVYILLGELDGQALAYIGEAEDMAARLRGHVRQKDWWETAILITTAADSLNKAHVKYLESRLVEMANAAKRVPLENGNMPTKSSLSESGIANMEAYLETLEMVLPAIQVDMFVNKAQSKQAREHPDMIIDLVEFELRTPKHRLVAFAELKDGEMIVKKGSTTRERWAARHDKGYKKDFESAVANGAIQIGSEGGVFTQDFAFSSPSAAAAIINGRATNGRTAWKLKGTNKTYAEWEAEQIEKDQ